MLPVILISANETIIAHTAVALSHAPQPTPLHSQHTLLPLPTTGQTILLDNASYPPTDPTVSAWLAKLPASCTLIWLLPATARGTPEEELAQRTTAVCLQHTLFLDQLHADHLLPLLTPPSAPSILLPPQILLNDLPHAALLWQYQGEGIFNLVEANPLAHELGHNQLDSFIGKPATHFFATDPTIPLRMQEAYNTGARQQLYRQYTLRTTGREGWFISYYIKLDEQYLLNLVQDITADYQAASAIVHRDIHLSSVWKYVSDALVLSDEHGRVIDANQAYLELYGYQAEEIIDQNFAVIFPPEFREQANRDYQAVFQNDTIPPTFENDIIHRDGTERMVETRINFITDGQGERLAMLSSIRDVTARKQAELALREREALLSSILNAMPGLLGIIDVATQKMRFISRRPDIFVWDDLPLDFAELKDIFLPNNLDKVQTYFESFETISMGEVRSLTLQVQNQMGTSQYLQGWHTPLTVDDHGRVSEILFIVMDVTEQEEAKQKLMRIQRRQQAILDALPDMVFRVSREGRIIDFQAPDERELLLPPHEVVNTYISEALPEEVAKIHLDSIARTLDTGQLTQLEYPLRLPHGMQEYEARFVPTGPDEVLAIVRNITDQKRMASELQMQMTQLQEARARLVHSEKLAAIGELVAGVAHELNNPVTTLVLNAELLQHYHGELVNPKLHTLLNNITQQALRSGNIVRGLLDFARQRSPERVPTQLNELLEATINLMAYELRTHQFTVTTNFDPALPEVVVDGQQIQQVLVNLLNNAMQAMPPEQTDKQIWLETRHDVPHGRVCFTLGDNGPGIPPDIQERIFEPFFTTKEVGKGTGLGLALCRSIIHEHQGKLILTSEVGAGTTFVITLPLTQPSLTANDHLVPPPKSAPPPPHSQRRILVVDDEPTILEACQVVLGEAYEVDVASNGSEALRFISRTPYDLIISDIFMPEMSGLDLYRYLREHAEYQTIQLLFMTGDLLDSYTQAFLEQMDTPVLPKPFTVKDLHTAVADMFQVVPAI